MHRVRVYEGSPSQGKYRLRRLGELRLEGTASLSRFWISHDRVYIYRDTGLFAVWDFVNPGLSSWDLEYGRGRRSCEVSTRHQALSLIHSLTLGPWFPAH